MEMTEECFQQGALEFAMPTVDLQNAKTGVDAPRHTVPALRVREGTWPPGKDWAVNPIPGFGPDGMNEFPFDPLVPGACGTKGETVSPECPDRVMNWRIIDKLRVPSNLIPGAYVLSFRSDSEQAPQIWASCSDIEITTGNSIGSIGSLGSPSSYALPPPPPSYSPRYAPSPAPARAPSPPHVSCGNCGCHACKPRAAYRLWYADWCADPYYQGCDGSHDSCQCTNTVSMASPPPPTPPPPLQAPPPPPPHGGNGAEAMTLASLTALVHSQGRQIQLLEELVNELLLK